MAKVWNVKDIYITENGRSATDVPAADGIVYDTDRVPRYFGPRYFS